MNSSLNLSFTEYLLEILFSFQVGISILEFTGGISKYEISSKRNLSEKHKTFIIFRCTTATYGALTSTSVTVNNTEYDPHGDSYHRQSAIGKAIQVNVTINPKRTISKTHFQPQNFPNEFKVSFSHPKLSEQADKANYNVMATDYKNYSIGKNIFRSA